MYPKLLSLYLDNHPTCIIKVSENNKLLFSGDFRAIGTQYITFLDKKNGKLRDLNFLLIKSVKFAGLIITIEI